MLVGQVVKVKPGHPMETLGRGTIQSIEEENAIKVAFALFARPDCDVRCLQLWFQAADLELEEVC